MAPSESGCESPGVDAMSMGATVETHLLGSSQQPHRVRFSECAVNGQISAYFQVIVLF